MEPAGDTRHRFRRFEESLQVADEQSRRRNLRTMTIEGVYLRSSDGQRMLNFGGNDYLGIVAEQSLQQFTRSGHISSGASASSLVCGWTPHHERLARSIASLEGAEAAVIFPSGYAACSGVISTLCREGDWILSDALNHASLIDGCRASKASREIYPHRDVGHVERLLRQQRHRYDSTWIVTDGVFSMDGDIAPVRDLVRLAGTYDAQVIVDEAHGTGVLGERGGGLCDAMGLQNQIPIRIGTLSKAIGHQGGFVAGPQVVIDYLLNFCRPLIFSTALAPVVAAGAADVIDLFGSWTDRREHLHQLSRHFRGRLGLPIEPIEGAIPIVPVVLGRDCDAVVASDRLRQQGFFVPAIRPPTVPEGTARLRISLNALHSTEQVDQLADAILEHAMPK
ncbi:aminotransferase class I/II-fold pyridoxal phosphate-dependent enzyme [Neorhodopirellula pilleata]|uniref:8-amino-7-oxononanoate synthase n=1 Tax=Neorhodopirellula pilleata TaxID=2714738 RepID=A0A5C6AQG5_9BACT|nr:8-amino-7-oxononanoate synthase [Neorhodopirellula pilleata]TWU01798.1 8-amino-7-oxononanoate synthase [Neorhodopirellula pilleata]